MQRPHACIRLRPTPPYGRPAFVAGLQRLGYDCDERPRRTPGPEDVLVIWNRRRPEEDAARQYERAGARVVVCENGYVGHDGKGGKLYAMALGHHGGAGRWPQGDPDRWQRQGIELRPWRTDGDFLLLLPQRGIGEKGVAMPTAWLPEVSARLRAVSTRPIRVRRHPGAVHGPALEPDADFVRAWASFTHGSGAGIKSIVAGIPVFCGRADWIGASAARVGYDDVERPFLGDREPMLRRLAWAQWSTAEIASGEAFARLLGMPT